MTVEQVRKFYEDKKDAKCTLTKELITSGYRQRSGGYIKTYKNAYGEYPDYRKGEPSQWWHLIRSYCDSKEPNDKFHHSIRCGELLFWMAEVLYNEGLLAPNDVNLNEIKTKAFKTAEKNSPKPFPNPNNPQQPLRTVEANSYIHSELFSKIVAAIEKYYNEA